MKAHMKFEIDGNLIEVTGRLKKGRANNILLAREQVWEEEKEKYKAAKMRVLLEIKDRYIAKALAGMQAGFDKSQFYGFSLNGNYYISAPYYRERSAAKFLRSMAQSSEEAIHICLSIIEEVSKLKLPYPLIYIILKAGKINIDTAKHIYFTYDLELSGLDANKSGADCAAECGYIIEELLAGREYESYGIIKVLKAKNNNGGYKSFSELKSDFKSEDLIKKLKVSRTDKIKAYFLRHKKLIVRLIVILSIGAIITAASMLLSKMVLRQGSFELIGTERLDEMPGDAD